MKDLWDFIESIQTDSKGFTDGEKLFIKDVFENENFTDIYNAINKLDNETTKRNNILTIIDSLVMLLNAKSLNQSRKDDKKRILREAIKILNETNTPFKPPHIKERRPSTIKDLKYELASLEIDYNSTKDRLVQRLNHINESQKLGISNNQINKFKKSIKITKEHIRLHNPRY